MPQEHTVMAPLNRLVLARARSETAVVRSFPARVAWCARSELRKTSPEEEAEASEGGRLTWPPDDAKGRNIARFNERDRHGARGARVR